MLPDLHYQAGGPPRVRPPERTSTIKKLGFLAATYRWFTDPPPPTFRSPQHQPEADTTTILHAITQYLIDLRPILRDGTYNRTIDKELAALTRAAYAVIDTYQYTKGAP